MSVLLIGTLDTKGTEFAFVRDQLRTAGVPVLVADASVIGEPAFPADISREELFALAGSKFAQVKSAGDRGNAVTLAAAGAAKLAEKLHREGKLGGIFGMGGSAGTTIATAAMRAVPVGVPKLMVSTLASGQVQPYVGTRDVMMMYSVVDIAGLNRISKLVLANAAHAMIGMHSLFVTRYSLLGSEGGISGSGEARITNNEQRRTIAASMFGVTTPCVEAARKILETAGYEVLVFHATGTGGRTMEELIRDGLIAGVLDITTTELADELAGGILTAGPNRLTAAAIKGIPQVISVGALDMVNFGPPETIPERYKNRQLYQHNPTVTLMRTTPEENDRLGKEIAEKACAASGPTRVLLPLRGVSAIDAEGKPFWNPEADAALFQSLRNWMYPPELLQEVDAHINDPVFAETAAKTVLELMGK